MKPKRIVLRCVPLFLALLLVALPFFSFDHSVPASANSAQTYFYGVDATGAVITGEKSPIVVEGERLVFDLAEFPSNYYETTEEFNAYRGSVRAEYTFYNPSEYTLTTKLLFPFGKIPGYYVYDGAEIDGTKYEITAAGAPVETRLRHTYSPSYAQFSLEEDLARLHDGFLEDEFFSPTLPVTKYLYRISQIDTDAFPSACVALFAPAFDGKTRYCIPALCGRQTSNSGYLGSVWYSSLDYGEEALVVYAIGEPPAQPPALSFYRDGGLNQGEQIAGNALLLSEERSDFLQFALVERPNESLISESDYYNAVLSFLSPSLLSDSDPFLTYPSLETLYDSLLRWYEYEIVLEPGERLVNAVTAPIYPAIDLGWSPCVYHYTYLLSPASTFTHFGSLEIAINTPYYLTDCSLDGFVKGEKGYTLTLEGLPDSELIFTLCSEENPESRGNAFWGLLLPLLALLISGVFFVLLPLVFLSEIGEFLLSLGGSPLTGMGIFLLGFLLLRFLIALLVLIVFLIKRAIKRRRRYTKPHSPH